MEFVLVSPLKDDVTAGAAATWMPIRPGTDAAMMLGIAHTLVTEQLYQKDFVDRYCVGFPQFKSYLLGISDAQPKDAEWAASICGIPSEQIRSLARRMAGRRALITVSQSLQRAEHGEQPVWMGIVLGALLGQIGIEGGGFSYGLGSMGSIGKGMVSVPLPTLAQGVNPVRAFIPVARVADMLLHPNEHFDYNGRRYAYPDIKLIYWAGGNPFHHHQDINRLRKAFGHPDTIIVHESAWTATARHADVVLPATITVERDDIGAAPTDPHLIAMHKLVEPWKEAKDDYEIFSLLSARLGKQEAFTEGRSTFDWLRHLYERTRKGNIERGFPGPDFDTFWEAGELELHVEPDKSGTIHAFRSDPEASPLRTPSGRIELFSETIAGFGYADCPGHPAWLAPLDGAGSEAVKRFPLLVLTNNPATRLHSQLDFGDHSYDSKIHGREPVRLNSVDAAARSIQTGDIVRLFNDRGACLAAAVLSDSVMRGVVQISTGAWYDPIDPAQAKPICVHGNPNVLTRDAGTSKLSQGCSGAITCIEIERFDGALPPIRAFDPPVSEKLGSDVGPTKGPYGAVK
jgi:biotin/methionine sulfoxide reductase